MIGFVTIGTSDFDRAIAFYDDLLGLIGIGQRKMWSSSPMQKPLKTTKRSITNCY